MTRLAATAGATPEETLGTVEAVPSVEGVDINDGWIIDKTQQVDCGNSLMKYVIALPGDPVPFECSPFQIDMRRDMIKLWMGAVRQAIVERAGSAVAATREAALKAKREKDMAGGGIQIADKVPTPEEAARLAGAVKQRPADPAIADEVIHERRLARQVPERQPEDPVAYAQSQLDKANDELEQWADMLEKATRNKNAAQKAAMKWKAMVMMLTDEAAPAKEDATVIRTASATRAEKLARKLQT